MNYQNNNSNDTSGGITFAGVLTVLFIALKLTKVIDWSWWWVLSPIWISLAFGVIYLILILIITYIIFKK